MVLYLLHLRGSGECYRAQADESWVQRSFSEPLQGGDFSSANAGSVRNKKVLVSFNHKRVVYVPDYFNKNVFSYAVRVLHREFPVVPDFEQLGEELKRGDNQFSTVVAVNVNGLFCLAQNTDPAKLVVDPQIVAYSESFKAYSGIVGGFTRGGQVRNLYRDFVCAWAEHLESGRIGSFCEPSSVSLEKSIERIERVRASWSPQF